MHKNVIIDNSTSFNKYYSRIKSDLKPVYHTLYGFEIPNKFYVKVWKGDHLMNKSIYRNAKVLEFKNRLRSLGVNVRSYSTQGSDFDFRSKITVLRKVATNPTPFNVMDLETININGFQQPLIISFCNSTGFPQVFINKNTNELFTLFFAYLFKNFTRKNNTIFLHNLGGFDGIFLHKFISTHFQDVETIIDDAGKYILIKLTFNNCTYTFKDSFRVFPVSLNDLSKVFNIDGKLSEYQSEWNDSSIINNEVLLQRQIRNRHLAIFSILGIPASLILMRFVSRSAAPI